MRILLHAGPQEHAGFALVFTTIFHASLLHQLQHQFLIVRDVWHHVQALSATITAQGIEKHDQVPL